METGWTSLSHVLDKSKPKHRALPLQMDWTDVHYRQLARLLSRKTWLWTEMVVDKTIIHTQQLDR